jgi:para-aminobenzoate synthetase/4-amino-4-deoxychorismate lyase
MHPAFDPALPFALFDDSLSAPVEARSRLYWALEETIVCSAPDGLDAALARIEAALRAGGHVALAADYELGGWIEPRAAVAAPPRPPLTACVFGRAATLDGDRVAQLLEAHAARLPARERICGIADLRQDIGEEDYLAAVRRILGYIVAGDCYQVNFTFPLRFRLYGDALALYARLRRAQPVRHGAFLRLPGRDILSLSPELFVRREGARLVTRPMKGTARRGADAATDAAQRDALRASEKNCAENLMIVDLIRNDLGRIAACGSVKVDALFDVEAYPTVWQMTSTVSAAVPGAGLARIVRALFPCGSVTGAPKIRAMQIIAELERAPRGLYTGALGWLQPDGDFAFNVPIRTLSIEAGGAGTLGIGSGIVADSDPADEYAESLLKAGFLTGLAADFELIETLLLEPGAPRPYPLLEDHLARLSASARYFGFRCEVERIAEALAGHARAQAGCGRRRARLLLAKDGGLRIESFPLEEAAPGRIVLAEARIDSRDLFRRHKTTVRAEYDAELARLRTQPGIFDAIFRNECGELCEGARTNLFLEFGGVLHTPPLASGALDGVMRRRLLREAPLPVIERTLREEDLYRAEAIYLSNAARGLWRTSLADAAAPQPA